jgi:signal transduction histidine kinase/DNA-binding response OmpR family regulator/HAMP domain-containing protein
MKIRDLKIRTLLFAGLSMLMLFVIIMGVVSFHNTNILHEQTHQMYEEPLQSRSAIGDIRSDVYLIHWSLETALALDDIVQMEPYIQTIVQSEANLQKNLDLLEKLLPDLKESLVRLRHITLECKSNRDMVIGLLQAGNDEKAEEINIHSGTVIGSDHLNEILSEIDILSRNARLSAENLLLRSEEIKTNLVVQLVALLSLLLVLSLLINFMVLHHVRSPLKSLTVTTQNFSNGNMSARSNYQSKNELGVLAKSFNTLAENIQANFDLNQKTSVLAATMLSTDDAESFFLSTMQKMLEQTRSQIAAAYLLSDDEKSYDLFQCIGLSNQARRSFDAKNVEGEIGLAASSGKIHHIKEISEKALFTFNVPGGNFRPSEIITIPILSGKKVIAVISIASIGKFNPSDLELIHAAHHTLDARIEGLMAFRKLRQFSKKLEIQNRELENQKTEMAEQSSELIHQNHELEQQKKELSEANKLKTTFLSNMSHELRTPLNSVIALSGVLGRRLSRQIPEEEYSYIEVIERNGRHLLSLINDILDIARIESGREELELTTFNVCEYVNIVADMIRPQLAEKNVELKTADGECNLKISSDAQKVQHILQNLIGNAVKFTHQGTISIHVEKKAVNIAITVKDTGIGIAEEHISHIFDEFRQADGGTSRRFGGTGLGLAIAKKYAHLLGGTITVKSRPDEGSEFTLILPLKYSNQPVEDEYSFNKFQNQTDNPLQQQCPDNDNPKTILLVEDSPSAIIQMKDFLEENGCTVIVANNGAEALQILEKTIPDAIILDLMMPEVDGFEMLRNIRNRSETGEVPVLILTAKHVTKEELSFLKKNNVYELIQKGDVQRDHLINAVAGMLSKNRDETAKVMPPQTVSKPVVKSKKAAILVVEDNPDNMITAKALLSETYNVIEAVDGKEAVEKAAKFKPDLILMDISLPVMDGIEAFKAIRNNPKLQHIPILALTASALISDRETILAHGFDGFLVKPIDEPRFFKTIQETLYGK